MNGPTESRAFKGTGFARFGKITLLLNRGCTADRRPSVQTIQYWRNCLPKKRKPNRSRRNYHKRTQSKRSGPTKRPPPVEFKPRINRKLRPILAGVGVPEQTPFVPDPFQVEAVEELISGDVVVSAPTGSGKTWIAEQAIERTLAAGGRAWYASPLKALSNAKFAEFGALFGEDRVGILTGDRKENTSAELIVGTTEILRNQLYDAMHRGQDLGASLVVLDEAHYLGDPDRGVVWEEVIIYLPTRVRLLLLSATVRNAKQIARWLNHVRDQNAQVIYSDERPVPLFPLFLAPDGEVTPLGDNRGGLFARVENYLENKSSQQRRGPLAHIPAFGQILRALEPADLLPAIFFLKSRSDCDGALVQVADARLKSDPQRQAAIGKIIDQMIEEYPFLAEHPQIQSLRTLQVAAHHAGHLPHWKLLVERLMQSGLLKAIFSTSTVAAGVNFPARSVVITQSDRFDGREFVDLRATDLLQMTGRAGRRGMDKIGFCLTVPGPFQNVELIAKLLSSPPDPIASQLHINFSMALNLLLSHQPPEIKQLLSMSLAAFQRMEQSGKKGRRPGGPNPLERQVGNKLDGTACSGPEEAVVRRRWMRRLRARRDGLDHQVQTADETDPRWAALGRGRVFLTRKKMPYAVLRREGCGPDAGLLAVGMTPDRRIQRGRPQLDHIDFNQVGDVLDTVIELPQSGGGRALAKSVLDQYPDEFTALSADELSALKDTEVARAKQMLLAADRELAHAPCTACDGAVSCREPGSPLDRALDKAEDSLHRVRDQSHAFWFDFVRHLEFLRSEGYVDPDGRLTQDGLWASKLRLDQPVLVAEAIRTQSLPMDDPVLLAALVALFVDDREREGESPRLAPRLAGAMDRLAEVLAPTVGRLQEWGFDTPPLPTRAAAACFAWGMLAPFEDTVGLYGGAEGDLAALLYRTADNLRQIISLADTHPRLASCAREAVDLLLRPPVVLPT